VNDNRYNDREDPQFSNGDFTKLKELILYRLDKSDEQRELLTEKIEKLTIEVRQNNAEHKLEYGLLKIKVVGLGAISAIVSAVITAIITTLEMLKRFKGMP
jgi:hypothetical protein